MRRFSVPFWVELSGALLLALLASNLFTFAILAADREQAVRGVHLRSALDRVAAVVELNRAAPGPAVHAFLEGASSRGEVMRIEDRAWLDKDFAPAAVSQRFSEALGGVGVRETRVAIRAEERPPPHARPPPGREGPRGRGPPPPLVQRLVVSAQLEDGSWLNAAFSLPRAPNVMQPMLLAGLVSALAMLVVAGFMALRLARPLQALGRAALAMRAGEAPAPVAERGPAPVRAATAAFNAMSAQVGATLAGQKALLAGLAHDLRTPITALKLRAEFISDRTLQGQIGRSLEELEALTNAALEAARAGGDGESARPFDLAALAESIVADLSEAGQSVAFFVGPPAHVVAKVDATRRALRNLVENAVRHGGAGRVRVETEAGMARVIVEDDGPGIAAQDLERVFDAFVRLDAARGAGGHGLGLTIARLVARGQGGDVMLSNRPEGGLSAVFWLPALKG
jgi:signal transduction histidine kinase